MTPVPISRNQYVAAGALAVAGLVLSFAIIRFFPEFLKPAISGAISGAFGILALQRLWPGLPLSKLHYIIGSIVAYGLLVGLVGRI
ncbi:hypothetical protein [Pararhodobacter sp. SW119]|uniref:hypothetical protein n=1 Tax=Pararhodobacter sp. SW119 TaxID=2780075 RepID=UPI001ADF1F3D|nr:hypothetical protein [Pararhodobacter sp. SW119]